MLEQLGIGTNWVTGELTAPLGRGINFQISVRYLLAAIAPSPITFVALQPLDHVRLP